MGLIEPRLRRFVLGDTDSEAIFHVLLTQMLADAPLDQARPVSSVIQALRRTLDVISTAVGETSVTDPLLLTLMITDGRVLAACQGGKDLYWSSYKNRCSDRDACASLSPECEAPTTTGRVNHCIISSEPLQGENVWERLAHGDVIGVDENMFVTRARINERHLPIVT
jgi:glutamine amidotransferase